MYALICSKPSQTKKKERNKGRANKKVKTIYNCFKIIDLDIREKLPINAFFYILLLSYNFFTFLQPTICLLLGIYFSLLYIYPSLLTYYFMTYRKKIPKKIKNRKRKNNYISVFYLAA